MALSPLQQSNLGKATSKAKQNFHKQFWGFMLGELQLADHQIQAYVRGLPDLFPFELDAGSRVVVRARISFLMAKGPRGNERSWMIGGQRIGDQWGTGPFEQAMEGRGPGPVQCKFTTAQLRTLDGLCEHYATAIRDEHLAPAVEQWLDGETNRLRSEMGLSGVDFATVRSLLMKQIQSVMYGMMAKERPMELLAKPDEIRKNPYQGKAGQGKYN